MDTSSDHRWNASRVPSLESFSYLMPQIKHKGNVMIGLVDVKANEIINIGFELQDAVYPLSSIKSPDLH